MNLKKGKVYKVTKSTSKHIQNYIHMYKHTVRVHIYTYI